MKKIMVLNGPNLNMLGIREKSLYGNETYDHLVEMIKSYAAENGIEVDCRQSNHEGDLIDWIQEAYFHDYDGVVINPGGYTHTSVALGDCVKAVEPLEVIEVHVSDISTREDFRHHSYLAPYCKAQIKGKGLNGYIEALKMLE